MKALVLFDSFFGNTEQIARAIGEGLASAGEVEVRRLGEVELAAAEGADLLIVGSPTRKFTFSPETKRFLTGIPDGGLAGVKVAAFDTRVDIETVNSKVLTFFVRLFGYAAEPMAKRLRKKGGAEIAPPAGFIVEGTEGPLRAGELERAVGWGTEIAGRLS